MIELVAEIGINHNGDINIAKKLIDIAYTFGCHYVKFQKRTIDAVYSQQELATLRDSPWGIRTHAQKHGLELSVDDYKEINEYCQDKIPWFASAWDVKSIFLVEQLGSKFIKVPSARLTCIPFLKVIRDTCSLPVILSTGMSKWNDIDSAMQILGDRVYAILHCTSTYPTAEEEINLNFIPELKKLHPKTKIGFSNHFPGIPHIVAAAALGAEMIEFHITLSRSMYGTDQASSFEPEGVWKISKYIKAIEKSLGDGIKRVYDSELPIIARLRDTYPANSDENNRLHSS